jgi:hypothetical protein
MVVPTANTHLDQSALGWLSHKVQQLAMVADLV